jgi:hypothetical protein
MKILAMDWPKKAKKSTIIIDIENNMEKEIILKLHKNFEGCSHEKDGVEFWYARELQGLLGYGRWENFESAINRAKIACEKAEQKVSDHFADATKTIPMPKGASKEIEEDLSLINLNYVINLPC